MIKNNFLLIALRYLKSNQDDNSINSMIKICFIGICIATCALALVVSVMQGFEKVTHQKMQSIYPDLILESPGNQLDTEKLQPILQEPQYHITHISEQRVGNALLYNSDYPTTPTVIFLRGINPEREQFVTALASKAINNLHQPFTNIIKGNHIFIGKKLAESLDLSIGDQATLLHTDDEPTQLKIQFQQTSIVIGGIFKTGIDEFDNNFAYCSTSFFDTILPDNGITQVYIKLQNHIHEQATTKLLKDRLNVDIYSWQTLYPTLVATLKLEKYVMFFILLLIVLIACMNLMSLTFMYITQKKKEIALFICFGMPLHKIKILFMSISFFITLCGTLCGLVAAYFIGKILQIYPIITLPDEVYLTTHLPIELDPLIFCAILIASLVISLLASIISTNKLQALKLVQVLKQE